MVKSKVNTLVASLDDTLIIRIQGLEHVQIHSKVVCLSKKEWAVFCCLPRCFSRELDEKKISWDLN